MLNYIFNMIMPYSIEISIRLNDNKSKTQFISIYATHKSVIFSPFKNEFENREVQFL